MAFILANSADPDEIHLYPIKWHFVFALTVCISTHPRISCVQSINRKSGVYVSIKFDIVKSEWHIVYIEGSQVILHFF